MTADEAVGVTVAPYPGKVGYVMVAGLSEKQAAVLMKMCDGYIANDSTRRVGGRLVRDMLVPSNQAGKVKRLLGLV